MAGTPTHTFFNATSGNFTFSFVPDAALSTLPTEVFVGRQFWYPTQFQRKVEPGGSMTGKFNATTSLLSLHYADTALPPSVTVSVWGH